MVVEDAFDEWKEGKTDFGYQLYWEEWWERDLTDMIRRDRNHPAVIMWSVGNEIIEVREGKPEGLHNPSNRVNRPKQTHNDLKALGKRTHLARGSIQEKG